MDERLKNYLEKHLTPDEQAAARSGSAAKRQLILMLVLTALCYAFFSWVSADMDRKIEHSKALQGEAGHKTNPWAKD